MNTPTTDTLERATGNLAKPLGKINDELSMAASEASGGARAATQHLSKAVTHATDLTQQKLREFGTNAKTGAKESVGRAGSYFRQRPLQAAGAGVALGLLAAAILKRRAG